MTARRSNGYTASPTHLGAYVSYDTIDASPSHISQSPLEESEYVDTIPRQHQVFSTVARILQCSNELCNDPSSSQRLWTDRWRPKCAEQVLGNEESALYLRDWLVAQRLHTESLQPSTPVKPGKKAKGGKKRKPRKDGRPDVVRQVKKRKTAWEELEEDFLVPDEFGDGLSYSDSYSDFGASDYDNFFERLHSEAITAESSRASSPLDPLGEDLILPPPVQRPNRFGNQINNTILLAGPSGSGKTAAVYACAEELGWEVFEVYPGIGERSGAELNKLIGDVGKNHTVKAAANQLASPIRKTKAKGAFFERARPGTRKGKDTQDTRRVLDSGEESLIHLNGTIEGPVVKDVAGTAGEGTRATAEPTVNQSVVLIEEVDVLYQTDTNFWPSLINIIKDCRRPVVLTCNDVSLVPCHSLPLQDILYFRPCPAPLAASYLQALCLAGGKQAKREDLTRLYETTRSSEHSSTVPDLRHTINQLQFRLSYVSGPSSFQQVSSGFDVSLDTDRVTEVAKASSHAQGSEQDQILHLLRGMEECLETHSLIDSILSRESIIPLQDVFIDQCPPCSDDELGYTLLYSPLDTDHIPISSFYQQDRQIVEQVARLSNNVYTTLTEGHPTYRASFTQDDSQLTYEAQMEGILARLRSWNSPAISKAALYMDYDPWIRYMVAVDDTREAQGSAVGLVSQSRRQTRNSQRSAQDRWIILLEDEKVFLASSAFPKEPDDVV